MHRRGAVLALLALGAPSFARAQAGAKLPRVVYLLFGLRARGSSSLSYPDQFKSGMRGLGWREGQNIDIGVMDAEFQVERVESLAKELVEQQVDVIVVGSPQATRAAQKATSTIPIVMSSVPSAVENKFVASLGRP